jgi:hypothetical protein
MTEQNPALTGSPTEQNAESVTPFAARRKSVARLVVLAVALFLGAGAFATLWTVERSNHQTTSGQLGDAQAEFRQVQLDLTGVTGANEDLATRTRKDEEETAGRQAEADALRPCTEAVREFYRAEETRLADAVFQLIRARCR